MTKYYKVMNDDETHNGLCYHNGLNSDIWEFQHYGGHGLYYAKEDILAFIRNDSRYIREVMIPDDAKVSKSNVRPDGWCADKLILGKRYDINKDTIEMLVNDGVNLHVCDDNILIYASNHGDYDMVKYCLDNGSNPNTENGRALRIAIDKQYGAIANLLLTEGGIDTSNTDLIEVTIVNNNLEILKNIASKLKDKSILITRGLPVAELLQRTECLLYLKSLKEQLSL